MRKFYIILFASICLISIVLFIVFNFCVHKNTYDDLVEKYSNEYRLEKEFVLAIIKAESNFDEKAVSKSGAMGLMQIIPSTAKWISEELDDFYLKENLFDAETNIRYGCFYLNYLFSKFNSINEVICAYNAGEGVVRQWLDENGNLIESKISIGETKIYYEKVKTYYENYKNKQKG